MSSFIEFVGKVRDSVLLVEECDCTEPDTCDLVLVSIARVAKIVQDETTRSFPDQSMPDADLAAVLSLMDLLRAKRGRETQRLVALQQFDAMAGAVS